LRFVPLRQCSAIPQFVCWCRTILDGFIPSRDGDVVVIVLQHPASSASLQPTDFPASFTKLHQAISTDGDVVLAMFIDAMALLGNEF